MKNISKRYIFLCIGALAPFLQGCLSHFSVKADNVTVTTEIDEESLPKEETTEEK